MSNTKKASKPQPQKLGSGKYAIFQTPEGDGVISYRPDGEEQDSHQVVPAKFWSMLMKNGGLKKGIMTNRKHLRTFTLLSPKLSWGHGLVGWLSATWTGTDTTTRPAIFATERRTKMFTTACRMARTKALRMEEHCWMSGTSFLSDFSWMQEKVVANFPGNLASA